MSNQKKVREKILDNEREIKWGCASHTKMQRIAAAGGVEDVITVPLRRLVEIVLYVA